MPSAFPWALGVGWDYTKLGIQDFCKPAFFWEQSLGVGQGCWADSSRASSSAGIKAWDHRAPGAIPPPWKGAGPMLVPSEMEGEEQALDH